ncbi:hypothetical protein NL676_017808 [Syzygium grande]|nr:hypothetical protein NL676_017808 [Syzygium grande]
MDGPVLDYVLVPAGLVVLLAYHAWLLHRVVRYPNKTIIGVNAINRRFWVQAMMEDSPKNGVLAVQTLRNNIMASTLLASTAIMLTSLIGLLMTGGNGDRSFLFVFGDKSPRSFSVKFFAILVCFLIAFLFNVQSVRYYSHGSILVNAPYKKMSPHHRHHQVTADYVAATVNRGSYFWSLGLRAFYFSLPLFLWIFGPVPMFVSCFVLVAMLYFLDVTVDFGWAVVPHNEEEDDHVGGGGNGDEESG